jgi:hypothetical protein
MFALGPSQYLITQEGLAHDATWTDAQPDPAPNSQRRKLSINT